MATKHEEGGSRLWRGMRSLLFGDDGERTAQRLRLWQREAADELWRQLDHVEHGKASAGRNARS